MDAQDLPAEIDCFFLTRTDRCERFLKVISYYGGCGEEGSARCCSARIPVDVIALPADTDGVPDDFVIRPGYKTWTASLSAVCDACGKPFDERASRDTHVRRIHSRSDGGPDTIISAAPPGAMWFADQMILSSGWYRGPDGHCLVVKLPGGHQWCVDARAGNCDRRDDDVHRCWVRHGVPPAVTVDKNGDTCNAGAGSILVPGYHGHLIDGKLKRCG